MNEMNIVRSNDRTSWTQLQDPPGAIPSGGREKEVFTSGDGKFTCGMWERDPDTWSFERPYDEVAYILEGLADVETADGRTLRVGAGDILVTPNGSEGTWLIAETLTKFYAIYSGAPVGDTAVRVIGRDDPVEWVELENPPGDDDPPGEEWYAYRSVDGRFSTGVWRRVPETGAFDLTYNEVACMTEGDVDIESEDGSVRSIGPGDVLSTPIGSKGIWRARTPVKKFWAVHHE
jgi:hypothetical protein